MSRRAVGRRPSALASALVAVLLGSAVSACGAGGSAGHLTILESWTAVEQAQFQRVTAAFTAQTGITVDVQGTRALDQVLQGDIQRGAPPDLAVLPSPADLAYYAGLGDAKPLTGVLTPQVLADYGPLWQDVVKAGTSQVYGEVVKADLKSAIWYDADHPPAGLGAQPDWQQLTGGGVRWCVGMSDPPASGWPGTDWIEDILLHQSGTGAYEALADGSIDWTSQPMRDAWTSWAQTFPGIYGSTSAALLTPEGEAAAALTAQPQECDLEHNASAVRLPASPGTPLSPLDFYPFPVVPSPSGRTPPPAAGDIDEVSADLLGVFHDSPQAETFIRWMATAPAQALWPRQDGATAVSVDRDVPVGTYHDAVSQRVAGILTSSGGASGPVLCFDASDLMPDAMANAFYQATLDYLQNPSPDNLTAILQQLNTVERANTAGRGAIPTCA